MAASDATFCPRRNTAFRATFPILDAAGNLVSAAAGLDSEVSKDGGTFADATSEATEIATNSGIYFLDLTATEMDADTVAVQVKTTSTGAKTTVLVFYTTTRDIDDLAYPTTSGRSIDVTAGGEVGLDLDNTSGTLGAAEFADGFLTAAKVATDAIDADAIADGAITSGSFAAGAIDATAIAANAIGSSEIADGAITAAKIATDAIDADALADGAITAGTFAAGAIDASAIATDAIGAAELADGAITSGVFASGAITADAIATDAIGSAELAASAVTEIQAGLATASAVADVQTDVDAILDDTGTSGVVVASIAANAITASAIATDAIGAAEIADGAITAGTFAAGAIDSSAIAANAIGSSELADGAITAAKIATDAIDADALATDAVTEIANGITAPSAGAIADAVWDEATAGHTTSGTFGEQVKTDIDAILADTAVIGATGEGLTSLASQASVNTIDDFLDTEVAAIKAKTDNLPAAPAATGDIPTAAQNAAAVIAATLTELASIPAASPTLGQAIGLLYMGLRNKVTTTSTQMKVHNDAGTAIGTGAVSDDGTTFTRGELA